MKKVIIVHGYTGRPDKNWFPWLRLELEKLNVEVIAPLMPNTDAPLFKKWLSSLQELVPNPSEETFLVGHSLGCPTILRYLESMPHGLKVGGALLVAGFAEPIHLEELNGFTSQPWDDRKIKDSVSRITLINSDNDEHVPLAMGERMRDRFDAKLVVLNKAGHINEKSGHAEVPIILEELKIIMGIH